MFVIRRWFWGINGQLLLAQGFCPVCKSSPPQSDCWVCHGSYEYGYRMTPERKGLWREKFDALR